MKKQGQTTRSVEYTEDILCNKCGESTKCPMGNFECISSTAHWGYSSRKDLEVHSYDLCEKCYDEFAKTFMIPPTTDDHLIY